MHPATEKLFKQMLVAIGEPTGSTANRAPTDNNPARVPPDRDIVHGVRVRTILQIIAYIVGMKREGERERESGASIDRCVDERCKASTGYRVEIARSNGRVYIF